ncbi:MAG: site-specific integrase [Nitrosopumilaceae archaeon]
MSKFTEPEKGKSYKVFEKSIKTNATLTNYDNWLYAFFKYSRYPNLDKITKIPTPKLQDLLKNWVMDLGQQLKPSSVKAYLAAVEHFLDMNEVTFHKKVVRALIKYDDSVLGGDVPFTTEEIARMLSSTTKLRTKALVHFLASTGIRPASIEDPALRKKHLYNIPNGCKAVKVYDESKYGYWTFLTPEAAASLEDYFKSRKLNGENLDDNSPIFKNEDSNNKKNDHLSKASLYQILNNVMETAKIERVKNGKRYDKALTYGFRKRFNGILKLNNEVNSNIAEKLMAHTNGLDGTYLKPTREQCFAEFAKAIQELTIDPSERQRLELEEKTKKISELEAKQKEIESMKQKQQAMDEKMDLMDDKIRELELEKEGNWEENMMDLVKDELRSDEGR